MKTYLRDCLGLDKIDRLYYDYPAPDLSPLSTIPAANKVAGNTLLGNQNTDINSFNTAYKNYFNDPKNNLTSIAGGISDQLGLPSLQANASSLNSALTNLPQTYNAATRGFDVNNNQLQRLIGQKTYEMQPSVTTANNALAAGQNQFGLLTSQAQQDIANRALPFQSQQALMADRFAREASMFTTENEQELNGLVAKINAGVTLNQGDLDRANRLAVAEKAYQGQLALANAQIQSATLQNQNYNLSPGNTLYNARTGGSYTAR